MVELLYVMQGFITLLAMESYLRKNEHWKIVYDYLNKGFVSFINWRADANIANEMKFIPDVFSKLFFLSFILIMISVLLGIKSINIYIFLIGLAGLSLIVTLSYNWVFNHAKTVKETKPVIYIFILISVIILINIYFGELYPDSITAMSQTYNFQLPTDNQVAIHFLLQMVGTILALYALMWLFSLVLPISILILLYITSKIAIYIRSKVNKNSVIGLIGLLQIFVFIGLYVYR